MREELGTSGRGPGVGHRGVGDIGVGWGHEGGVGDITEWLGTSSRGRGVGLGHWDRSGLSQRGHRVWA